MKYATWLLCGILTQTMKRLDDSIGMPFWLWRTAAAMLVLVIIVGVMSALWLGTRPVVTGAPIPSSELGVWTFGPGASGDEVPGQLTLRGSGAVGVTFATSELDLSDSAIQVRAAWSSGPEDAGYGLIVRCASPDDFVAMLIGPDGYVAIGQMSGGMWQWRVPWQQWPHIKRGRAENLLRAQCRADQCRFYVNDEFAFQVEHVPLQGRVGPAVWNPAKGENVSAVFREWQLWK